MQYSKYTLSDNLRKAKTKFETELYKVSVPYLQTLSKFEMEEYGVYQSGVKDIDKDIYSQMTTIYVPAITILQYFKDGATIRLPNANDIKDIYTTIQNYLEAWRLTLENGINLAEAPSVDLLDLDKLATEIFSRAKYYFGSKEAESLLVNYLTQNQRTTSHNFFDKSINTLLNNGSSNASQGNDGLVTINSIDEREQQERESLTDFFKNKMYSTRFHR